MTSEQPLASKLMSAIRQQLADNNARLKAYYADGASVANGAPSSVDATELRGANAALRKVLSDCGVDESSDQ